MHIQVPEVQQVGMFYCLWRAAHWPEKPTIKQFLITKRYSYKYYFLKTFMINLKTVGGKSSPWHTNLFDLPLCDLMMQATHDEYTSLWIVGYLHEICSICLDITTPIDVLNNTPKQDGIWISDYYGIVYQDDKASDLCSSHLTFKEINFTSFSFDARRPP